MTILKEKSVPRDFDSAKIHRPSPGFQIPTHESSSGSKKPFAVIFLIFSLAFQSTFYCRSQTNYSWNFVVNRCPIGINSIVYGNGRFVGYGGIFMNYDYNSVGGEFITSPDGSNWTIYSLTPAIFGGGIAFGNGAFLAFGTNYQDKVNYILQSSSGLDWQRIGTTSSTMFSAAYGNNMWVLISTNAIGVLNTSNNVWNLSEYQPGFSPNCIVWANGEFLVGATFGRWYAIFSSSDGSSWQYRSSLNLNYLINNGYPTRTGIAYGNKTYVASSPACHYYDTNFQEQSVSQIFTSSNLVDWVSTFTNTGVPFNPVAFGGNHFAITIGLWYPYLSTNGYNWEVNLAGFQGLGTLAYGQGTFVGASPYYQGGAIMQSSVFSTNSPSSVNALTISTYPGITINGTVGANYQIQSTINPVSGWQAMTNIILPCSPFLWIDTSQSVSTKKFYRSLLVP